MPIYEYSCSECGEFEVTQRITASPLRRCPNCKGKVKKLISNTSFQLKGGGWYATDYAKKGSGSEAKTGGDGSEAKAGGDGSEAKAGGDGTKAEGTTEAKTGTDAKESTKKESKAGDKGKGKAKAKGEGAKAA